MPSAFEHGPSITIPASPAANSVAAWSAANNLGATIAMNSANLSGAIADDDIVLIYDTSTSSLKTVAKSVFVAGLGGATLSGSTDNTIVTVTGSNAMQGEANLTWNGSLLNSTQAVDGDLSIRLSNTRNTDNGDKTIIDLRNGTSGGDIMVYMYNGAVEWNMGMDNSDGDKWKLSRSGDLGTNDAIVVDTSNRVTKPSQPAVFAKNGATDNNVTGGNQYPTVDYDTEIFDQGGNFTGDTFTAPIDGRYLFAVKVIFSGIETNHTNGNIQLATSNQSFNQYFNLGATYLSGHSNTVQEVVIAHMDANDTAKVVAQVNGGSQTLDIAYDSYFSCCLLA